jgi:hypothetical protein
MNDIGGRENPEEDGGTRTSRNLGIKVEEYPEEKWRSTGRDRSNIGDT